MGYRKRKDGLTTNNNRTIVDLRRSSLDLCRSALSLSLSPSPPQIVLFMRNLWDSETANQQRTRGWSYNVCRYSRGVFIYFIYFIYICRLYVMFVSLNVHPHYLNRRKKQVRLPRFSQEASRPRRSLTKEEFLMEQILHRLIGGKHPIILHWVSSGYVWKWCIPPMK